MGQAAYPRATRLLITADSGGSNGARVRLWKVGSARESERSVILRGLLKGDELGSGRGHALGFEQEVAEIPIAAAAA